jgi:hypothetical protein
VTSDVQNSKRADRFHSVFFFGVFAFFCAARGPGTWFLGAEGAKYVSPHPREPI